MDGPKVCIAFLDGVTCDRVVGLSTLHTNGECYGSLTVLFSVRRYHLDGAPGAVCCWHRDAHSPAAGILSISLCDTYDVGLSLSA